MALRVIVEVEGGQYRLIHAQHVDMPAPAAPVAGGAIGEGIYAELRDERDEPLAQRSLSGQLETAVEVFSPEGGARRVPAPDRKQTVMLVLPDDDLDARSLVFLRVPEPRRGRGRVAAEASDDPQELARFTLE